MYAPKHFRMLTIILPKSASFMCSTTQTQISILAALQNHASTYQSQIKATLFSMSSTTP